MAVEGGGNMAPLAFGGKAKALVQHGLGCTGDEGGKGGAGERQDKGVRRAKRKAVVGVARWAR